MIVGRCPGRDGILAPGTIRTGGKMARHGRWRWALFFRRGAL